MSSREKSRRNVIYSFKGKWLHPLSNRSVKVFFRKKSPISKPDTIFLYVGSPTSSVIGYASVPRMERISKTEALKMAEDGCISKVELENYLKNSNEVTAIFIEDFKIFKNAIGIEEISRSIVFHPPQNFVSLSDDDASIIKEMRN